MLRVALSEPGRSDLRSFGVLMSLVIAALFGLALPWVREHEFPVWPWILAVLLLAAAAAAPRLLRPVYRAWMGFGLVMGRITTPLILGALFLVVVTPIARVRALLGRDALARRRDATATSYRIASKTQTAKNLERPY